MQEVMINLKNIQNGMDKTLQCTECDEEFSDVRNFYPKKLSKNEYV